MSPDQNCTSVDFNILKNHSINVFKYLITENIFLLEVLKQMNEENEVICERKMDNYGCGESMSAENVDDNMSGDKNSKKDYQLKIIKVTNIYKCASLKHYIKQRRLRKANKQALFNKKVCVLINIHNYYNNINLHSSRFF